MPSAKRTRPVRTVLVTGASSGIGRATARVFADEGFQVFGTSRQPLGSEAGVRMLPLNVCCQESVTRCVTEILDHTSHIDVLVNNAGMMLEGFTEETTLAEVADVFATNFYGTVRVTNAVLPGMRQRRSGRVINIGSLAAWIGEPGEGFYAASKAALARYTEALRHEVWHCGIRVSLVEPGPFATGVLQSAATATSTIRDYDRAREHTRRTLHQALRNGDDPRTAAALILKVASARSPRSRYGTGPAARWLPIVKVLLPQPALDHLVRRDFRLRAQDLSAGPRR